MTKQIARGMILVQQCLLTFYEGAYYQHKEGIGEITV
jgi:hypothetical protein